MVVLAKDSAESVAPAYVQALDLVRFERSGDSSQGCGTGQGPVGTVLVVVPLVDPQYATQVGRVPDEGPVEKFGPKRPDSAFHDRVHPRHLHACQNSRDASTLQDLIHHGRILGVPVPDQKPHCG